MWPTLFRIPIIDIPIRSFGVLVMVGFLVGVLYSARLAKKFGTDPENDPAKVNDLAFWMLVGIFLGARLLYVIVHPEQFSENPFLILAFWEGGMVFYGGFFGCFLLGIWKTRQYKLDLWTTADYMFVAGMVGYGIGRWGCLLVGDDYGRETDVFWALRVPDPLPQDSLFPERLIGHLIHPTQLYMSASGFLIAAIGRWFLSRRKFKGQVCWTIFLLYATGRFIIEFLRGDDFERGFYGPLSTSQWIGIFLAGLSILMLWRFSKNESLKLSGRLRK